MPYEGSGQTKNQKKSKVEKIKSLKKLGQDFGRGGGAKRKHGSVRYHRPRNMIILLFNPDQL